MAGNLRRQDNLQGEEQIIMRALRDCNIPKFSPSDAILFNGILGDLFPGVTIKDTLNEILMDEISFLA